MEGVGRMKFQKRIEKELGTRKKTRQHKDKARHTK
jgi:hypothetical protein